MVQPPESQETERTEHAPQHSASLYSAVAASVYRLHNALVSGNPPSVSHARATLSQLRQVAGQSPGANPLTWSIIIEELLPQLPETELGKGATPTYGEWAGFTALSMFALHQRSLSQSMHEPKTNLGAAVGRLKLKSGSESIKPRLDALMLATTPRAIQYHLRNLIGMLQAHELPVDYGRLAEDLKRLRFSNGRAQVAITWGRSYAQATRPRTQEQSN